MKKRDNGRKSKGMNKGENIACVYWRRDVVKRITNPHTKQLKIENVMLVE